MELKDNPLLDELIEKERKKWGYAKISDEEIERIKEEERNRRERMRAKAEIQRKEERKNRRKRLLATMGKVITAAIGIVAALTTILAYLGLTPDVIRSYLVNGK